MLQSQPVCANACLEIFWNICIENKEVFNLNNTKGHDVRNVENIAKPDMPGDQDLVQPPHLHRNCDQRG